MALRVKRGLVPPLVPFSLMPFVILKGEAEIVALLPQGFQRRHHGWNPFQWLLARCVHAASVAYTSPGMHAIVVVVVSGCFLLCLVLGEMEAELLGTYGQAS